MVFLIKADSSLQGDDQVRMIKAIHGACERYGELWVEDRDRMMFGGRWNTSVVIDGRDPKAAFDEMRQKFEALGCEVLELQCECQIFAHLQED